MSQLKIPADTALARALLGAAVGAGMALLGALLSEPDSIGVPYTVLLVLAIGIIGLILDGIMKQVERIDLVRWRHGG